MIPFLVTLLVAVLVACVLLYVTRLLISGFRVGQPWGNVIYAIVVLLVLCIALAELGAFGPAAAPYGWRR